jgi:hypothetical protein
VARRGAGDIKKAEGRPSAFCAAFAFLGARNLHASHWLNQMPLTSKCACRLAPHASNSVYFPGR